MLYVIPVVVPVICYYTSLSTLSDTSTVITSDIIF